MRGILSSVAILSLVTSPAGGDGGFHKGAALIEASERSVASVSPDSVAEQVRRVTCEADYPAWRITEYGARGEIIEQRGWTGEVGYVADFLVDQIAMSPSPRLDGDDRWLVELVGRSPSHVGLCSTDLMMSRGRNSGDEASPTGSLRLVLGDGATRLELEHDDRGEVIAIRSSVGIAGEPAPFIERTFTIDDSDGLDAAQLTEIARDRGSGAVTFRRHVTFRIVERLQTPHAGELHEVPDMPPGMSVVDMRHAIMFNEGDRVVRTASREVQLDAPASATNVQPILAELRGSPATGGFSFAAPLIAVIAIAVAALLHGRRCLSCRGS